MNETPKGVIHPIFHWLYYNEVKKNGFSQTIKTSSLRWVPSLKTTCCHCEKRFSAFYVTGNFPTVWVSLEGGSTKSSRDNEELTFSLCLKNPKNQVKFFFLSEPSWVHKGLTSHNHLLCCWTSKMANDTLALK